MNTYDIEAKLNNKADKWQLHNVENENNRLKTELNNLEKEVDNLRAYHNNAMQGFRRIIDILATHPDFAEQENELQSIKQYL